MVEQARSATAFDLLDPSARAQSFEVGRAVDVPQGGQVCQRVQEVDRDSKKACGARLLGVASDRIESHAEAHKHEHTVCHH